MKAKIFAQILACMLIAIQIGNAQFAEKPVVNLIIDADTPASKSDQQFQEASASLHEIYMELNTRNLDATFFATQDMVSSYGRLRLTYIGQSPDFELAMSGESLDENLSTESFSDQKAKLERSMEAIKACRVCGKNEVAVWGFMPPSFVQNEDTYKVLDELGIEYNAGFQSGLIYAPGHKDDVWPYKFDDYDFYAVPVSTFDFSGQKVPLHDRYFLESGLSSTQWYDALASKLDETQVKDEPMVIMITRSISASGDYFDALKRFLDLAISKDVTFVATKDLVNLSREEAYVPPAEAGKNQKEDEFVGISINTIGNTTNTTNATSGCPTCDSKAEIQASIVN